MRKSDPGGGLTAQRHPCRAGSASCRAHPLPLAASSGKEKRQRWVPASPAGISVRWVGPTQEKWKKEEMREAARTRLLLRQGAKATRAGREWGRAAGESPAAVMGHHGVTPGHGSDTQQLVGLATSV